MSGAVRRKPGERVAMVIRGHVASRTAPVGRVLDRGPHWQIEDPADTVPSLRLRWDNVTVDVEVGEIMTAVRRSVLTEYDDDYGLPLTPTAATRPDGTVVDVADDGAVFCGNDRFTVHVRPVADELGLDGPVRISVHDHQRSTEVPWRLMQRIKNEVVGPNRWAIEWFPDEEHLVDESNERHLFVMPAGEVPPAWLCHLGPRSVSDVDEAAAVGAVQAPLPDWYPEATR